MLGTAALNVRLIAKQMMRVSYRYEHVNKFPVILG